MYQCIANISILIVMFIHITYLKAGVELLLATKHKLMSSIFIVLGVVGGIFTILVLKDIFVLHIIIILDFLAWLFVISLLIKKSNS